VKRAQRQQCQVTLAPEKGKGEPMPGKYHNLSNEALADELGRVDAIAKAAEAVMKPIAAPIVGGMITSTINVLILVPVFLVMMKARAMRQGKLYGPD
jgi:hypothetical protein